MSSVIRDHNLLNLIPGDLDRSLSVGLGDTDIIYFRFFSFLLCINVLSFLWGHESQDRLETEKFVMQCSTCVSISILSTVIKALDIPTL